MRYDASLAAGGLKVRESRIIADLLLRGVKNGAAWREALFGRNVLQASSPQTAKRIGGLVRGRLELMDEELWELIRDGTAETAAHACLSATVKKSPLLGDFLDLVVRYEYKTHALRLSYTLWDTYISDCRNRDPDMPALSRSTIKRLRSSVFQSLAQAGYIESTHNPSLQNVCIDNRVTDYLRRRQENYVLRCIKVGL